MKFSLSPDYVSGPHRGHRAAEDPDRPEPQHPHHSAKSDGRPSVAEQEREWAEYDQYVDNDHDGLS